MARRGTSKRLSVDHETFVARAYGGVRSPSSGGAVVDAGDVRTATELIECKATMTPATLPKKLMSDFEKIAQEAYAEGKDPVVCLRSYNPDSILAGRDGWIDLTVRLTADDAERGS